MEYSNSQLREAVGEFIHNERDRRRISSGDNSGGLKHDRRIPA